LIRKKIRRYRKEVDWSRRRGDFLRAAIFEAQGRRLEALMKYAKIGSRLMPPDVSKAYAET